jgi:hypothetical protein
MICELCNWINRTVSKILNDDSAFQQCVYDLEDVVFTLLFGGIIILCSPVIYPSSRMWGKLRNIEFKCKKARK